MEDTPEDPLSTHYVVAFRGNGDGDDDDEGIATPEGFQDPVDPWLVSGHRKSGGISDAMTQVDSEATHPLTMSAPSSGGPVMAIKSVSSPVMGDGSGALSEDTSQRRLEETDEDETQILMSLSQDPEMTRSTMRRIEEEELEHAPTVPSEDAAKATEDASDAESDMSDDMLEQDGDMNSLSSIAANFQHTETTHSAFTPTPRSSSRSRFLTSSIVSVGADMDDSSGAETEAEQEPDTTAIPDQNAASTDTAQERLHLPDNLVASPSGPSEAVTGSGKRAASETMPSQGSGRRVKRINLSPEPLQTIGSRGARRGRTRGASTDSSEKEVSELESNGHITEDQHHDPAVSTETETLSPDRATIREEEAKIDSSCSDAAKRGGSVADGHDNSDANTISTSGKSAKSKKATKKAPQVQPSATSHNQAEEISLEPLQSSLDGYSIRIMFTGLDGTLSKLREKVKKIADAVQEDADVQNVTHLIAPRNQLKRTVKLLCGISHCDHILDERWLDESARTGIPASEPSRCLKDVKAESKWHFSLYRTMYDVPKTQRKQLLRGLQFFITNHKSVLPPVSDLVKIVACAGGVATSKGRAKAEDIVISTEVALSVASVQKAVSDAQPGRMYTPELILSGILQQRLDWDSHHVTQAITTKKMATRTRR